MGYINYKVFLATGCGLKITSTKCSVKHLKNGMEILSVDK